MRSLTEQEHALLEAFHATRISSLRRERKRREAARDWSTIEADFREAFSDLTAEERVRAAAARLTVNGFPVGRPRTIPEAGPWTCRNGHAWGDVTVATYGRAGRMHCRRCANIATVRSRRIRRQREAARRVQR